MKNIISSILIIFLSFNVSAKEIINQNKSHQLEKVASFSFTKKIESSSGNLISLMSCEKTIYKGNIEKIICDEYIEI